MKRFWDYIETHLASVEIAIDSIVPVLAQEADYGNDGDDNMEIDENESRYDDIKGCGETEDYIQRVEGWEDIAGEFQRPKNQHEKSWIDSLSANKIEVL